MADIELKSNVAEIEKAMEQAKKRALEKVGMFVETGAKKLAPVDTGRLRNSITFSTEKDYGSYSYQDNDGNSYTQQMPKADKNEVIIGTAVEYAPFVELGTSKANAQPYLRPAIDNNKDTINKIIKSELGNS